MKLPAIEITIDEIVLHGLEPAHRHEFADALEMKLTHLAQEAAVTGTQWRSRDESSRRVPTVALEHSDGLHLGEAVAATVATVVSGGGPR